MNEVIQAFLSHDLIELIKAVGLIGVFTIIFAESGLLIGFFLPGDSLIFTAGFLASPTIGFFDIWPLVIGSWIAAVVGDNVGYEFGKRVGRKLFRRQESRLFKPENLIKAEEFYKKHGGKAIILARFMPIVRTFAPIVAGVGHMNRGRFMFFNIIGGTLWVFGLSFLGYFLGSAIPGIDRYLLPIIGVIVVLSVLPPVIHIIKESDKTATEHAASILKRVKYWIWSFFPTKEEK